MKRRLFLVMLIEHGKRGGFLVCFEIKLLVSLSHRRYENIATDKHIVLLFLIYHLSLTSKTLSASDTRWLRRGRIRTDLRSQIQICCSNVSSLRFCRLPQSSISAQKKKLPIRQLPNLTIRRFRCFFRFSFQIHYSFLRYFTGTSLVSQTLLTER